MKNAGFVLALIAALTGTSAFAAPVTPQTITVQGHLSDKSSGTPVPANGAFNMTFTLHDAASGGLLVDSAGPLLVTVVNGLYEVELPFPAASFEQADRYLELTVDGETLAPRIRLASAPFAYSAERIGGMEADDLDESDEILAHAGDADAHREHASLEESAEIVAGIETHAAAADAHAGYLHVSGGTMQGTLVLNPAAGDALVVSTGNVGIGTTPTQALDVVGNVRATAFIGDGSQLTGIHSCISRDEFYCGCDWDDDGDVDAKDIDDCYDQAVASLGTNEDGTHDGSAWVVLPDGEFAMGDYMPWDIPNGLHIRGVPLRFKIIPGSRTANHVRKEFTGGSILDCGDGDCFTGRDWQGNVFRDFGLTNFTKGFEVGGDGIQSGYEVRLENLILIGDPDREGTCATGLHIYNPLHWYLESVAVQDCARGLQITCQTNGQPGNSIISDFDFAANNASFANTYTDTQGGILVEALEPTTGDQKGCNYLTFIRPQVWAASQGSCQPDHVTGGGTEWCEGSSKIWLKGISTAPITFTSIYAANMEGATGNTIRCEYCRNGFFDIRPGSPGTAGADHGSLLFDDGSIQNVVISNDIRARLDNRSITNVFYGVYGETSVNGVRTAAGVQFTTDYLDGGGNVGTIFSGDRIILGDGPTQDALFHDTASGVMRYTKAEDSSSSENTIDISTIGLQAKPPLIGGRYYNSATQPEGFTTTYVPAANSLYLVPFYVPQGGLTFDQIGLEVNSPDALASARLCVYELDHATGLCSTLLHESADLSLGSIGVISETDLSIGIDEPRWICLGYIDNSTVAQVDSYNGYAVDLNLGEADFTSNSTWPFFVDPIGSLDCPSPAQATASDLQMGGSAYMPSVRVRVKP